MPSIPVPTLSTSGFVETLGEKLDRLLAYFCVSESNQSDLFRYKVSSLSGLVAEYGDEPGSLCSAMKNTLTDYFSHYFDQVEVDVTYKYDNEKQQAGRYSLFTDLVAKDSESGERRHLFREIKMNGSLFLAIAKINDDGIKDREI